MNARVSRPWSEEKAKWRGRATPASPIIAHPVRSVNTKQASPPKDSVRVVQSVGSIIHLGAVAGNPACALSGALTFKVDLAATRTPPRCRETGGQPVAGLQATLSLVGKARRESHPTKTQLSQPNSITIPTGSVGQGPLLPVIMRTSDGRLPSHIVVAAPM